MAKVVNGGNKKGKIGNSIYYTIKNSNNKVTQGERIYQPNVTNPQSESQRAQRMKLKPAWESDITRIFIVHQPFQSCI